MAVWTSGNRDNIERLLNQRCWNEARLALDTLWREQRNTSTAQFILTCYQRMRGAVSLQERRVVILRSFTVEPLVPMLRAASVLLGGLDLIVRMGDFNSYAQEIIAADSFLYRFDPHAVILAIQARDIAPELWYGYADLTEKQEAQAVERVLRSFQDWIETFRARSTASLLVHNFEQPDVSRQGLLDSVSRRSQISAIQRLNDGIRQLAMTHAGVYPFDYDALVARHGRRGWQDDRKWLTVRFPISSNSVVHLVEEWTRYLMPIFGKSVKVLVTDLDNTLWRGVVGEDGPQGIRMDEQYPGAIYRNVQRVLLDLHRRGILLAVASKNNEADALKVIEDHPDMLLRPQHFAAIRCNWLDKAQNLRSIAEELNVGSDSLAFVDDSPVERDLVRRQLPEVAVIELPSDPISYARTLQEFPLFQRLSLSAEDQERSRHYAVQRQRQQFKDQLGSLEEFFRQLQQQVEIFGASRETVPRVAQLTLKTNQFNLTNRRYTEGEIAAFLQTPGVNVYEVRVKDRFGDNGIVGVCITRRKGPVCEIDTLLLSCRVIHRTVETAVLSFVAQESARAGAGRLEGWFLPTPKNGPAKSFYPSHHFKLECEKDGNSLWSLDLSCAAIKCPDWISLAHETQSSIRDTIHCQ